MASATYMRGYCKDARQLTDEERHQLLRALVQQSSVTVASLPQTHSEPDRAAAEALDAMEAAMRELDSPKQ